MGKKFITHAFTISEEFEEGVFNKYIKLVETDPTYQEALAKTLTKAVGRGAGLRKKSKKNKHKSFKIKFAIVQELQRIMATQDVQQHEDETTEDNYTA